MAFLPRDRGPRRRHRGGVETYGSKPRVGQSHHRRRRIWLLPPLPRDRSPSWTEYTPAHDPQPRMRKVMMPQFCCFVAFLVVSLLAMWTPDVGAQQRAETPQTGKSPGGHVGLRGGYSPPGGELGVFNFNRYYIAGNLKNASGDTIRSAAVSTYTNITGAEYVSEYKVFGM